jgi:predicted DsbA family dithiol-disulfide isomerase
VCPLLLQKQGGKPRTQEAKLAYAAAKASNRAMPTRFTTNMLALYFWQERLLNALVEME